MGSNRAIPKQLASREGITREIREAVPKAKKGLCGRGLLPLNIVDIVKAVQYIPTAAIYTWGRFRLIPCGPPTGALSVAARNRSGMAKHNSISSPMALYFLASYPHTYISPRPTNDELHAL